MVVGHFLTTHTLTNIFSMDLFTLLKAELLLKAVIKRIYNLLLSFKFFLFYSGTKMARVLLYKNIASEIKRIN